MCSAANPFSRTPRGFEATRCGKGHRTAHSLSAEPLVGLKRSDLSFVAESLRTFSRTPRGFEASLRRQSHQCDLTFSRTPRGFEADVWTTSAFSEDTLSAEPLVGLKHRRGVWGCRPMSTFSRTPRGFEANYFAIFEPDLDNFQPNPSWV